MILFLFSLSKLSWNWIAYKCGFICYILRRASPTHQYQAHDLQRKCFVIMQVFVVCRGRTLEVIEVV